MKKHFTKLKHRDHKEWNNISVETLQGIIEHIYIGYIRFFNKTSKRPPSFRKASRFCTIPFKKRGWSFNGKTLTINKQNLKLDLFISRQIEGEIRGITLKKDRVGDWWIIFMVRKESFETQKNITTGNAAGVDFGLKNFLTLDDGTKISAPLPLKNTLKEIRSASRFLSKKKTDSKNHQKARIRYARLHKKIVNQRSDFHWKLAIWFIKNYDIIFVENLNVVSMQRHWGRRIEDLGFYSFLQKLDWECKKNFKELVQIDRFEPTTRKCSNCGYCNVKIPLKTRYWVCPKCGAYLDRDVNAARNILRAGAPALGRGDVRRAWSAVPVEARI